MIKLETSLLSWKHLNSFGNITNNFETTLLNNYVNNYVSKLI